MPRQTMTSAAVLVGLLMTLHAAGGEMTELLRYDRDALQWYGFFTASLVHYDLPHLLANILIFGLVVLLFQEELTARRLWLVTVICGAAAVAFEHLFGKPPFMPYLIEETYGLSGACYGLLMYCAVARVLRRDVVGLYVGTILTLKVIIEALHQGPLFYSSVETPSVYGHVGGVLSGALLAVVIRNFCAAETDCEET